VGEGLINHKDIVKALKDVEYDRTVTLEVFTSENDAKVSADKLKAMWHSHQNLLSSLIYIRRISFSWRIWLSVLRPIDGPLANFQVE